MDRLALVVLCPASVVGFFATTLAAGVTNVDGTVALQTQGPRTSGPVSASLQNEIDAAVDRGREWLLAQQNADGSWGTHADTRTRATALASLALLHEVTVAQRAAALRGCRWLAQNPSPVMPDAPAANAAWRLLTLRMAASLAPTLSSAMTAASAGATNRVITPMHAMLLRELGLATTNAAGAPVVLPPDDLTGDCLCAIPSPEGMSASAIPTNLLTRLAGQWPVLISSFRKPTARGCPQQAWIFARFINRACGGTLADAQGCILDWRNDLAKELVSSQTIDLFGHGGYWKSFNRSDLPPPFDPIEDTAFALLALDEL